MPGPTRHFACTQCGLCCNRPPEVELGEAAALADVFIWQLMFRLYSLPKVPDGGENGLAREQASAEFYEAKRRLSRFAAYSYHANAVADGRKQPRTFFLTISVLALDLQSGSCAALAGGRCSIYPRRPLSCRSVPLHYSRPEAAAAGDLDSFTANPGYACDNGPAAPLVVQDGRIVSDAVRAARSDAEARADTDREWKAAIFKAMKQGKYGLPSLAQIEQNAPRGALTMPMRIGWRAALDAGLIESADYAQAVAAQIDLLDRTGQRTPPAVPLYQTLAELRRAYAAQD